LTQLEIVLWSGCLGIYASYACLSLFYAIYNRAWSGLQTVLFVTFCAAFVLFGSGLGQQLWSLKNADNTLLVMLSGPLAGAYASLGLRNFLRAEQRDALVDKGMLGVVFVCAASWLALLWPDRQLGLEMAALGCVGASLIAFWLTLRAWLLGDRFALPMALASAAMTFAVLGLFGVSLKAIADNLVLQSAVALMAAFYVVVVCHTMKRRHADYRRMSRALSMSREKDLLTQVWTGVALIRKVDESIARARRNRKEMAVMCVEIYNTALLRQEHGNNGLEQVIYGMAARIRKASGSVAAVGRYSDTSFVIVLDSVKQPGSLRTIGLRLATAVRRPYILNAFSSDPREFKGDVGVGVARVAAGREARKRDLNTSYAGEFDSFSMAQDVLHEAAELAVASKKFSSRAAILDSYSRKSVALEAAELG
jgi:GGDEF domain-containing protein